MPPEPYPANPRACWAVPWILFLLTRLPSHTVNPSPHSSSSRRHPFLHDRLSRTGSRATRFTLVATLLATAVGFASAQSAPQAPKKVSANWTWAGWGGGGYFWSNAWDPADPNTLYLGGDVCGIYKSTDRGKSWFFVNNGLHEYGVYGLAAAPSQSGVLYCMTPNGMARTTNGGAEWVPLEETMRNRLNLSSHRPGSVRPIAVHPTNPKALYAGSAKGYLYRSADGGETWQEVDYLAPLRAAPQKPIAEPSSGAGFLCATMKAGSGIWDKSGRLEQYYGVPQDWSGYEKLVLEITTDGSIHPKEALKEAAKILIHHFMLFSDEKITLETSDAEGNEEFDEEVLHMRQLLKTKLVDMDLSVRALNCLKAADVETLGDLVQFNKTDLLKFRNFGKKSLTELDDLLESLNLSFGTDISKYKLDKE